MEIIVQADYQPMGDGIVSYAVIIINKNGIEPESHRRVGSNIEEAIFEAIKSAGLKLDIITSPQHIAGSRSVPLSKIIESVGGGSIVYVPHQLKKDQSFPVLLPLRTPADTEMADFYERLLNLVYG